MAGECGVILKVVEPIRSFVFDAIGEYVGYIGSCEDNLGALRKSLSEVCDKKDDIKKKVKVGNDKQEEITREAATWLKDVRLLTEDEELKGLMYKDIETAKFVVKLMGKKVLKRRVSQESELQELVVKVMKKLTEDMDKSDEEMRKILEVDYKQVAEVVVEVMKDTIDEFKKLMKEDKRMAVIATRMLKDRDLDKLTKGDLEMQEIVGEVGYASDEELQPRVPHHDNVESSVLQPLLVKVPEDGVGKNRVKEAAKKMFTPLANLVIPLGKLMDDANFKKVVPEAEGVKLGLEVIDGLLIKGRGFKKEKDGSTKQQRGCCCCSSLSLCNDYHGRYLISKAAKFMGKHIRDDLISKCPKDPVTLRIRAIDLKAIPTRFLKGLDSRTKLLQQVLKNLNDDQVDVVGLFGMGGTGKTILAKEVNKRVNDAFSIKVMVEVSDAPNIFNIQAAIAESIDLPLHDVDSVSQRAIRLYNRLISMKKKKKILIILDNVWKKINLDEIGISHTCKILLTTRDKEVCRKMGAKDINILEIGVMNTNEAGKLFRSQVGNQGDDREYKNVIERLLSKCGGLPLAIAATANSLKDKDLPTWEKFAHDLEKPFSSQVTGDYHRAYSILNTSYKFIENDEKRLFFLLASLSPVGSSASIETLMRYGIGLSLFQHVNNLCEAFEQAATWANELVQSSMLLEGDVKGDVKIHDIVRAFAILSAAKEEKHKFMVEDIPRWIEDEAFKNFTAISLMSRNDYSRLSGVDASRLQILVLKGDQSLNFSDIFFEGMVNLVVLDLSNMNFKAGLPKSMWKMKRLRTLCMERCKLGDIKQVGDLVNLRILSLRKSFMIELPKEIGKLHQLRLLDLSGCLCSKSSLIPAGVLGELSKLEGLYIYSEDQVIFDTKLNDEIITATESSSLPYLNAFEVRVLETEELPIDGQSIENVDKFRVSVGDCSAEDEKVQQYRRVLYFTGVDNVCGFLEKSCLKVLPKKADFLEMFFCKNIEHIVPQLDQEGFIDLRYLDLFICNDIKYIVDGHKANNLIAFPCLQSLRLKALGNIQTVYNGEAPQGSFSNLQTLELHYLVKLLYVLPLVPRNLHEICVSYCNVLKFIFTENEDIKEVIELPFLKILKLVHLPCLLNLVGPKDLSNTNNSVQEQQIFFDGKFVLPALEQLELVVCNSAVMLWSKEIYTCGFHNLKNIKIQLCEKLLCIGPSYVFSILLQLETLSITECKEMREVISFEAREEVEIGEQVIKFPQLSYLELGDLSTLESFYGGGYKLEFPKLKKFAMYNLERMHIFAKSENNSSFLFHQKIDFPCLEELKVRSVNDEVMGLWEDNQAWSVVSNPAPMLRTLKLGRTAGLRHTPSVLLENLISLKLTYFDDDVVFASSDAGKKERFVWTYSQLPNLEELEVRNSCSLKELFEKEDDCNTSLALFCGKVKTLKLKLLRSLNLVPLKLFKGLTSLILHRLNWNSVFSVDPLGISLEQLENLSITKCDYMRAIVTVDGSLVKFPRLKRLLLSNLRSIVSFSATPESEAALLLPSLESLEISFCRILKHFWSGSIVAPRLQDIELRGCGCLRQILVGNPDDVMELPALQKVCIERCFCFNSISSGPLKIPKLTEVSLGACHRMQCFFPGNLNLNEDIHLPSFETLDIYDSENLQAFSLTRLLTPKLNYVRFGANRYRLLNSDGLNDLLQSIHAESMPKDDADS